MIVLNSLAPKRLSKLRHGQWQVLRATLELLTIRAERTRGAAWCALVYVNLTRILGDANAAKLLCREDNWRQALVHSAVAESGEDALWDLRQHSTWAGTVSWSACDIDPASGMCSLQVASDRSHFMLPLRAFM